MAKKKKKKEEKKMNRTVSKFAKELEMWAKEDKGREALVKWLLTRTVSHEFEVHAAARQPVVEQYNLEVIVSATCLRIHIDDPLTVAIAAILSAVY